MEVLAQAQALVAEHAFTIGIGLLVASILAGCIWFWMSQSASKSSVLVNQARVNEASTAGSTENVPTQEQLEEMARIRATQESQADNQVPNE